MKINTICGWWDLLPLHFFIRRHWVWDHRRHSLHLFDPFGASAGELLREVRLFHQRIRLLAACRNSWIIKNLSRKFSYYFFLSLLNLHIKQVLPPHPGGQAQKNRDWERVVRQVPPFLQGLSSHGPTVNWLLVGGKIHFCQVNYSLTQFAESSRKSARAKAVKLTSFWTCARRAGGPVLTRVWCAGIKV